MRSLNAIGAPAGTEGWSNICSPRDGAGAPDPEATVLPLVVQRLRHRLQAGWHAGEDRLPPEGRRQHRLHRLQRGQRQAPGQRRHLVVPHRLHLHLPAIQAHDINAVAVHFNNKGLAQAAPGHAGFLCGVTAWAVTDSNGFSLGIRHRF